MRARRSAPCLGPAEVRHPPSPQKQIPPSVSRGRLTHSARQEHWNLLLLLLPPVPSLPPHLRLLCRSQPTLLTSALTLHQKGFKKAPSTPLTRAWPPGGLFPAASVTFLGRGWPSGGPGLHLSPAWHSLLLHQEEGKDTCLLGPSERVNEETPVNCAVQYK